MESVLENTRRVKAGEIITVRVIGADEHNIIVDVGLKSEGLVPREELSKLGQVNVGQELPALVKKINGPDGHSLLSILEARQFLAWQDIKTAYGRKLKVKGVVMRRVKGGFAVDLGVDAFLPLTQVDIKVVGHPEEWLGKEIEVLITELQEGRGNIVVSRRQLLEAERRKLQEETRKNLAEGQVRKGKVTKILQYGAFVDIGGIEGLLHKSEISWSCHDQVENMLKTGQEFEVKVVKYDPDADKVALSLKQLLPDPWENVKSKFHNGDVVTGRITGVYHDGLFVEVSPGVDGLVHLSELTWTDSVGDLKKLKLNGTKIKVQILSINFAERRLALSVKRLDPNPWEQVAARYPNGAKFACKVKKLANFGAFAEIPQFPELEGLIHINDTFWTDPAPGLSSILTPGKEVEVIVLGPDANRGRLSLGLKQTTADPFTEYRKGMTVSGTVTRKPRENVMISLSRYAEGLIRPLHITESPIAGAEVSAVVVNVDRKSRVIELSMTKYEEVQERAIMKKYLKPKNYPTLAETTNWESAGKQ